MPIYVVAIVVIVLLTGFVASDSETQVKAGL